ncbi:MAG: flagellar basal body-associated FliL family protein [Methylococcales bacterium]|nr:flagellar basal body-associated FliL family protein [Methylococcales bacterium]
MAEQNAATEEPKKSKKMLMIGLVAGVLLLGGGAAGFFLMQDDAADDQVAEAEESVAAQEPDGELLYLAMMKPLVVNFSNDSYARLIQLGLSHQVRGEANIALLKKHEPMIRSNLLMLISKQSAQTLATREGKQVLRDQIKQDINAAVAKIGGASNVVQDVFFTSFVMQ